VPRPSAGASAAKAISVATTRRAHCLRLGERLSSVSQLSSVEWLKATDGKTTLRIAKTFRPRAKQKYVRAAQPWHVGGVCRIASPVTFEMRGCLLYHAPSHRTRVATRSNALAKFTGGEPRVFHSAPHPVRSLPKQGWVVPDRFRVSRSSPNCTGPSAWNGVRNWRGTTRALRREGVVRVARGRTEHAREEVAETSLTRAKARSFGFRVLGVNEKPTRDESPRTPRNGSTIIGMMWC
jgi:hypothetical protein